MKGKPKTNPKTLPEKGKSKTVANKGRGVELTALFLKTPEMQEDKTKDLDGNFVSLGRLRASR